MNPLAFDTETCLIRPAQLAPPMVCLSWQRPGFEPKLAHVHESAPRLRPWLNDPSTLFVGHNVAYDMAVICAQFPEYTRLVFDAYRSNRITCTKIRQQLLDIAGGVYRGHVGERGKWHVHKYDLADAVKRHLGWPMQKDGWRYYYDRFLDVPLERWRDRAVEVQAWARVRRAELPATTDKSTPEAVKKEIANLEALIADVPEGAALYPLKDAEGTLGVFLSQEKHAEYLKDQYRQAYAYFVLYLSSCWGLRTHAPGVEALRAELEEAYGEVEAELTQIGLVRENGTRDMKAVKLMMIDACREYGLPVRRTDGHAKPDAECGGLDSCEEHVCLDSDACEAVVEAATAADGGADCPFMDYAEFVALKKMLSNDVKMLEGGTVYPVHTRYDLAETGRTTSSKPNIQNLNTGRIKNKNSTAQRLRPGVRQAFIPRPGKVFAQADYPQLELYTLAQCCVSWLGFSKLAEALNGGLDPHLQMAARILGISYQEALANRPKGSPRFKEVDEARQIGKVFNFGKPGGLGNKKLIVWARKTYGVIMTPEKCEEYTATWKSEFPEMGAYFARIGQLFDDEHERASVETLFTERHRGGASYCAACNNGFQALGVDCAKAGLCLVGEAQYCDTASPLYGSRTVAFVHDEIIAETDDAPGAHDAAFELARLMVQGANRYLPDVPIPVSKMEPTLMRAWSKEAKQVFEGGRLVPWAPS